MHDNNYVWVYNATDFSIEIIFVLVWKQKHDQIEQRKWMDILKKIEKKTTNVEYCRHSRFCCYITLIQPGINISNTTFD